jgi:hypothetical protein
VPQQMKNRHVVAAPVRLSVRGIAS